MKDVDVMLELLSLPDRIFAVFSEVMREDDNARYVIETYGDVIESLIPYMFAHLLEKAKEADLSRAPQ